MCLSDKERYWENIICRLRSWSRPEGDDKEPILRDFVLFSDSRKNICPKYTISYYISIYYILLIYLLIRGFLDCIVINILFKGTVHLKMKNLSYSSVCQWKAGYDFIVHNTFLELYSKTALKHCATTLFTPLFRGISEKKVQEVAAWVGPRIQGCTLCLFKIIWEFQGFWRLGWHWMSCPEPFCVFFWYFVLFLFLVYFSRVGRILQRCFAVKLQKYLVD